VYRSSGSTRVTLPETTLPPNNLALALRAFYLVDMQLACRAEVLRIQQALTGWQLPGRMELIAGSPEVYVDVCHNPHAARYLSALLARLRDGRSVIAVFSALDDKDIEGVVGALSVQVDRWFVAPLDVPRAASIQRLEQAVRVCTQDVLSCSSVSSAIHTACDQAQDDTLILVFGSFYTVAEAKDFMTKGSSKSL